jgi:hypothetical protein
MRAEGPLIAAITSEADSATRVAYPFGRSIANLGTSFRDADSMPNATRCLPVRNIGRREQLGSMSRPAPLTLTKKETTDRGPHAAAVGDDAAAQTSLHLEQ